MDDKRCVICQQQSPSIFVTRYMGSYTSTIPSQEFTKLQGKPGLYFLSSVEAYFDDKGHFETIRALCSYTHPALEGVTAVSNFRHLKELKYNLQNARQLQFCDICLEGRKVFIPEQIAYSKPELERHMRSGDLTGPMAESGFKGHPQCQFCRKRFYGDNELFVHMQSAHEQCFLCRRARPDRYVYYKDYNELEEHFRHVHHLCEDQTCLEKKFIVFPSEQELKQHVAREHGGNMSRAEKRQALTIPVNFQYRRGQEPASSSGQQSGAAGIVIGGAGDVRSRFGRRGQPENDQRQISSAVQASIESAQAEHAQRSSAAAGCDSTAASQGETEEPQPAFTGPTHWAAAAGRSGAAQIRPEDFPALPGSSKSAKKRAKAKEKLQDGNRSSSAVDLLGSEHPSLSQSTSAPDLQAEAHREPEWQEVAAPQQRHIQQQQRLSALQRKAAASASTASEAFPALSSAAGPSSTHAPQPARLSAPPAGAFPPLAPAAATARPALWGAAASSAPKSGGPAQQQPPRPRRMEEEFPVLGQTGPSLVSAPAQPIAVSDSLKAANKALMERIRGQLNEEDLGTFRSHAAAYMRGDRDAESYYMVVASLGLASLVPDMAALLPDPLKRGELLSLHSAAAPSPSEAAAAVVHASQNASWQCQRCSLINGPAAGSSCEACGSRRTKQPADSSGAGASMSAAAAVAGDFPALGAANGLAYGHGAGSSGNQVSGAGKKAKKVPKFERLRLTGGDPAATAAWLDTSGGTKTKPQNVWTQGRPAVAGGGGTQPRGSWAAKDKLAREWRGINDAWDKK
ncbi:g1435 [Coccomyxa elongata]